MKNDVIHTDRRTDIINITGAFHDCTNAPSNENFSHINPLKPSDTFIFNAQISAFSPHTIHLRAPYDYHNDPTNHYFYLGGFTCVWLKTPHFCDKMIRQSLVGSHNFEAIYYRRIQGHVNPHSG
jgi:hypothetical protein